MNLLPAMLFICRRNLLPCTLSGYGYHHELCWRADNISPKVLRASYVLVQCGRPLLSIMFSLPGTVFWHQVLVGANKLTCSYLDCLLQSVNWLQL